MNRKLLSLSVLILTLVTFVVFTQTVAQAAPTRQDSPVTDTEPAAPAPLLRIQISERVPFTVTAIAASSITGTMTNTVTSTQGMAYVFDLMLDFDVDTRMTDSMTMTVPSTLTMMGADGITMTVPISIELAISPTALVTVTALPIPAPEITATADVTATTPVTEAEEVTVTPPVTATPPITTTPPVTSTPVITEPVDTGGEAVGATTTVTANLRSGPGSDFDIVQTVGPATAIEPVATNDDGTWYFLSDNSWIFAELVANPPTDLPVATEELLAQVAADAAAQATPTPTPQPTATATPEPTAAPTIAPTAVVTETGTTTDTATTTPTDTVTVDPVAPSVNVNANLRAGPGTNFDQIGGTISGQTVNVVGQNAAGDWYLLDNGGWISANLVDNAPADIPVVADDATPESLGVTAAPQGPRLPTPTPIPQPAPEEPTTGSLALGAEETIFLDEAQNFIARYGTTVATLTELGGNAAANVALLQEAEWTDTVNAAIGVLKRTGEQIRDADTPPLFAAGHIDLIAAANAYDEASASLEQALSQESLESLQQAIAQFGAADTLLESAEAKLETATP